MRRFLLSAILLSGVIANAQEDYTATTVSMQAGYADQVYFDFSSGTQTPVAVNSWDLAFLRTSAQSIGTRVNDSRGIQVYEASNNIADWETIDVNNEAGWTPLYNSETAWEAGAFDNGSATYGWGEYNPATHHVSGTVIFVLKYADASYRKMTIQDYFGGYTIKHAAWNGTEWGTDQTATVANGSSSNTFNYFSLDTNSTVAVAPANTDWDLAFTRYYGNIGTDEDPTIYFVSGVLHNSASVSVAQVDETGNTENEPAAPDTSAYSQNINTIGDDWKTFNMDTFTYDIDGETTYYVKEANGTIYRMYFTGFGGSANGNMQFNYKNISETAGLETTDNVTFGFYPNPASDNITLIYDLTSDFASEGSVSIFALNGTKVHEVAVNKNAGLYTRQVNISGLNAGVYIVTLKAGETTVSKKLIIR